ncbi:MAG TPA: YafY family protein [Ktedonobacterales bacterium]|nr:YafY family protein [Ktedonobacterales bacterium]
MYYPTTRVLTVLELLQSRARMSGPELAARLEVDVRTVRRYVTMLQSLGIPIEAGRGRYGAYRLRPGYKLPPLMLTEDEALAVVLGLLAARRLGLAATAPDVEGALAKIERVLPVALRERVQAVQETLVLAVEQEGVAAERAVVLTLGAATQQSRRVWLRYQAYDGRDTERTVDPYGLVYRAGRWYMAGYCHLREDVRVFRLDRVTSAEPLDETFTRPADFDTLAVVERGIASVPDTWEVVVLLRMSLEKARRRIPAATGHLEETPDGVLFRCYRQELGWVAHLLVGLGCPVVVREPPELRAVLRELAARAIEMADEPR